MTGIGKIASLPREIREQLDVLGWEWPVVGGWWRKRLAETSQIKPNQTKSNLLWGWEVGWEWPAASGQWTVLGDESGRWNTAWSNPVKPSQTESNQSNQSTQEV
jgi:hypothetical protein